MESIRRSFLWQLLCAPVLAMWAGLRSSEAKPLLDPIPPAPSPDVSLGAKPAGVVDRTTCVQKLSWQHQDIRVLILLREVIDHNIRDMVDEVHYSLDILCVRNGVPTHLDGTKTFVNLPGGWEQACRWLQYCYGYIAPDDTYTKQRHQSFLTKVAAFGGLDGLRRFASGPPTDAEYPGARTQ